MIAIRCRWRFLTIIRIVTFAALASPSRGQGTTQSTLGDIVPASSKVFLHIHDLRGLQRVLQRAKGVRLTAFTSEGAQEPQDLRLESVIQNIAGPGYPIPLDELQRCEIGLVADSLVGIANPVWLVRAPEEALIRRWFPQHVQPNPEASSANVFRTDDGRFVCIRGRVVAVAPRASGWAELGNVLRALTGAEPDTLGRQAAYREALTYLPSRPLATLYFATAPTGIGESPDRSLAVGLYAKDETVDLAFHGSKWRTLGGGAIAQYAVERFLKLPQTTLGAYLTRVDWGAITSKPQSGTPGVMARYVRLVKELAQADADNAQTPRLGQHLIAAWGQDFSPKGTTPQVAVLLDTPQALQMTQSANRVAASLVRILSTLELRDVAEQLPVEESSYLGVPVFSVPLRRYAGSSRFAWVKMLEDLSPSWAASGNWFVVTLTPEHMHQLLDAQIGFLSTLDNDRSVRTLRDPSQKNSAIAYLQGSMASTTMHFWERSLQELQAAGALRTLWKADSPAQNNKSLGIEIGDDDIPGVVEVTNVTPSTPAHGRLKAGDWILGADGRLLEMASPEQDLRSWWDKTEPGSIHSLRVLRGSELVELEVIRRPDENAMADLLSQPLTLLRELTRLCEAIPAATLQIHDAENQHFSALLRLRLDAAEQ